MSQADSPKTVLIAIVSNLSFSGVEVPWRVHVVDIGGLDLRVLERHRHRADAAVAALGGLRDVVGVADGGVAADLGEDLRPARLRVVGAFQHEDAGAFAHDEPIAFGVEGPGGGGGQLVACRERASSGEAGHGHLADRRFGAAGEHDVGVAAADRFGGEAERVGGAGAGGDGGEIGSARTERDADLAARHVRQHHRDHEGRNALGSAGIEDAELRFGGDDPADPGADHHAGAVGAFEVAESGVPHGLVGGRDSELAVAVHPPRFLLGHVVGGLPVGHLRGDLHAQAVRVEQVDLLDAGAAGGEALPVSTRL